eukprot:TRINITY_DN43254_c0_g1_i1.p1 TRINITY_DN43254_c0_g1~~TRINITY_DN43254_c0_g1_i1.p1  ORF type:complete len:832 (+),score=251.00 TRINITY_DN43254_c0_g1_i1:81-2576(+)
MPNPRPMQYPRPTLRQSVSNLSGVLKLQVKTELESGVSRPRFTTVSRALAVAGPLVAAVQFGAAVAVAGGDDVASHLIGLAAGLVCACAVSILLVLKASAFCSDLTGMETRVAGMPGIPRGEDLPVDNVPMHFAETHSMHQAVLVTEASMLQYKRLLPGAVVDVHVPDDDETDVSDSDDESIEAPEGDVTIVFTDIQSSTRLWEQCSDAMNEALSLHNSAIRRRLKMCNGYEVKTIGDAFMCAFASPVQAVRFALEVQVDLVTRAWPRQLESCDAAAYGQLANGDPLWAGLRVRIGAHTGPAILEHNPLTDRADYRGSTVNKAARVESQSQGGMLVVTKELFTLIEPRLSELGKPEFHRLGERTLKGVKEPVELFLMLPQRLAERWKSFGTEPAKPKRRRSVAKGKFIMTPFGAIEAQAVGDPTSPASPQQGDDGEERRESRAVDADGPDLQAFGLTFSSDKLGGKYKKARQKKGPAVPIGVLRHRQASLAILQLASFQGPPVGGDIATHMLPTDVMSHASELVRAAMLEGHSTQGVIEATTGDSVMVSWNVAQESALHTSQALRFAALMWSRVPPMVSCGITTGQVIFGNAGSESQMFRLIAGKVVAAGSCLAMHAHAMGTFCLALQFIAGAPFAPLSRFLRPVDTWLEDDGSILTVMEPDLENILLTEEDDGVWESHLAAASPKSSAAARRQQPGDDDDGGEAPAKGEETAQLQPDDAQHPVPHRAQYADRFRSALAGSTEALAQMVAALEETPRDLLLHKVCYNLEQHQTAVAGSGMPKLWRVHAPWVYGVKLPPSAVDASSGGRSAGTAGVLPPTEQDPPPGVLGFA